jgi:hypothetical protein
VTTPSAGAIKRALVVVMFVGAANQDATQEQRARLRDEALPPLKDEALTPGQAYEKTVRTTAAIMGPDWRPTGVWDEWITALLDEAATS